MLIGVLGLVLGGAVVAALPLWFPWLLRPFLESVGIRFGTYERLGYARFALHQLQGEPDGLTINVARLESLVPTAWVWHAIRRSAGRDFVIGESWRVEFAPTETPTTAPPELRTTLDTIDALLPAIRQWVPAVRLTDGVIVLPGDELTVESVRWEHGRLEAAVASARLQQAGQLTLDLAQAKRHSITIQIRPVGVAVESELTRRAEFWELAGVVSWADNRLNFFGELGEPLLPHRARVAVPTLRVPADCVGLPDYDELTGSLLVEWDSGHFQVHADGAANSTSNGLIRIDLAAHGDLESAVVERLDIDTPWLRLNLPDSVRLFREGQLLTNAALLQVGGEYLAGVLHAVPTGTNYFPDADFELAGANLLIRGIDLDHVHLAGTLEWPILDIPTFAVSFDTTSVFTAAVRIDLARRWIERAEWRYHGGWLRRFLPEESGLEAATARGQITGAYTNVEHVGELVAEQLAIPPLKPVRLTGHWGGAGVTSVTGAVQVAAGGSTVTLAASLTNQTVTLQTLTLQRDATVVYRLEQPSRLTWAPPGTVALAPLRWTGPDRALSLAAEIAGPHHGKLQAQWRGLTLEDFRDFVSVPVQEIVVPDFQAQAAWTDNQPLAFRLTAAGKVVVTNGWSFSTEVKLTGDATGVTAAPVVVFSEAGKIISIDGNVPVLIHPGRPQWWSVRAEAPLNLQISTESNPAFWDRLAELARIRVTEPNVQLVLHGTPAAPVGSLELRATVAELPAWNVPRLTQLQLSGEIRARSLLLKQFTFEVEDQPVTITGELPLAEEFWGELAQARTLPSWRTGSAKIVIADAELKPFARYLPDVLAPTGRLNVELLLQPGGRLAGELRITDAAVRPFPPFPPIHDIDARVTFADRTATLEEARGDVGGQAVVVTGQVQLPAGAPPEFSVQVRGANVPLVREPGLLLRGDLAVQLVQTQGGPAVIAGELGLRNSVFLQDLKLLTPQLAVPERRPPYFSVKKEPFANWKLNLKIHGNRFLRVRSPFFRGELSGAFQLQGTLAAPIALGELNVEEGSVQFPFSDFRVETGQIRLTSEDPFRPKLFVTATARTFGYDAQMSVTGTAEAPVVRFSSTPPLSSPQILLMVTSGELPRSEFAFTAQQRASTLALFLGKRLLTQFGSDDTVAADRLAIRSGEDLTEAGRPTYSVEYKLAPRWSVVGEYDRFNAFNLGVKLRVYSK